MWAFVEVKTKVEGTRTINVAWIQQVTKDQIILVGNTGTIINVEEQEIEKVKLKIKHYYL